MIAHLVLFFYYLENLKTKNYICNAKRKNNI